MVGEQKEIKVVIGADNYNNNPGWVHTQKEGFNFIDKTTWEKQYKKDSITAILAEHVWEHLTYQEGMEAAQLCHQYLKPGGYIRCAVPDGYFRDEAEKMFNQSFFSYSLFIEVYFDERLLHEIN